MPGGSSFWESPGGSAAISAGASILDGAFGGGSELGPSHRKRMRKYQEDVTAGYIRDVGPRMSAYTEAAKTAGLHPLFAMGSGQSFGAALAPPAGQSPRGSGISDAVQAAQSAYQQTATFQAQKDLIDAQADLARARALEQVTSNDNAIEVVSRAPHGPDFDPGTQEFKKGEYQARKKGGTREQSADFKRPMKQFAVGSQNIWLPIEDMDQLTEDPAAVIALAATYHGNKNIDWPLFIQEYRHGKFMTPRQATGATRRAFERMARNQRAAAKRRRAKARRPYVSDQFYGYSRGPNR